MIDRIVNLGSIALMLVLTALLAPEARGAGTAMVLQQAEGREASLYFSQDAATEDEVLDEGKHKITFDPFHLSLLKGGRVKATVDIQLVLQLHDNKDYETLNTMKPQLRADITAALSTLARQRWRVTRPIDPDIVSAYLTPFVEHRVGAGKLNVYVLNALINPE